MARCPSCGSYRKPWFKECYSCHMRSIQQLGFIRSLILFIYMPPIPTILVLIFKDTLISIGITSELLALFCIFTAILLVAHQYREFNNMIKQFRKRNWW
jgi:hypothetical protein